MKYDLIIVGGGPGGCMAARTAARDGLKVLLVEKGKEDGRITRFCSRNLRVGAGGFSSNAVSTDVEIRRATVTIEVGSGEHRIHLKNLPPDAAIDYRGELNPVFNETFVSPSGHTFSRNHRHRDIEGFVVDKDQLVTGLLAEATAAGCVVRHGSKCTGMADGPDGVRVKLKSGAGEEVLVARRAVVADGSFSPLLDQIGFNEGRSAGRGRVKFMNLILDRVKFPFPEMRRVRLCVPSRHTGMINMGPWPPGAFQISTSAGVSNDVSLPEILSNFLVNSPFSDVFSGARVIGKQACNMDLRPPVRDAARGNIICVGDNVAYAETAIKGALGCGYTAARSTREALEGGDGNGSYNHYWTHAFNFFSPQYNRRARGVRKITEALNDAETDRLFQWFEAHDIAGLPNDIIVEQREALEQDLPDIYPKLLRTAKDGAARQAA